MLVGVLSNTASCQSTAEDEARKDPLTMMASAPKSHLLDVRKDHQLVTQVDRRGRCLFRDLPSVLSETERWSALGIAHALVFLSSYLQLLIDIWRIQYVCSHRYELLWVSETVSSRTFAQILDYYRCEHSPARHHLPLRPP